MAKQVPVWRSIFYKKGMTRYLSFKAAGAHGNRPVIRLKKNRKQSSRNTDHAPIIPELHDLALKLKIYA